MIKAVFPEAKVEAVGDDYCNTVTIECVSPLKTQVSQVPQRDLFRKYQWPAAPQIENKLKLLKEVLDEM